MVAAPTVHPNHESGPAVVFRWHASRRAGVPNFAMRGARDRTARGAVGPLSCVCLRPTALSFSVSPRRWRMRVCLLSCHGGCVSVWFFSYTLVFLRIQRIPSLTQSYTRLLSPALSDEVVTREVRVVRKQASQSKRVASGGGGHTANTELRQERIDRRSRKTSRRDQVAPSDGTKRMNRSGGSQRRSSSSKKSQLKLDTTAKGLRSNADLRSPGQRKSPVFQDNADDDAAAEQPIPDFITQTDRYGNASTPRNKDAARVPSSPTEETTPDEDDSSHVEACAETFLDSLRLVCCCLAPEQSGGDGDEKQQQQQAIVSAQKENVPRLLPAMHPDDAGKKCLVLDLDETLVHSSFRAVPGADFIIPVQVCISIGTIIFEIVPRMVQCSHASRSCRLACKSLHVTLDRGRGALCLRHEAPGGG